MSKVIVIGGGPSGIIAAGFAAQNGNEVILLEKNDKLGKKLFITGKGRCNITNACDIEDLIKNSIGNGNFLYSAFYTFSNDSVIDFFNNLGVKTKVEHGNRVFPNSDKSNDVIKALEKFLIQNKVKVSLNSEVGNAYKNNNEFILELADGKKLICDKLIIATGGVTYPNTGSTGDGYRFAKTFGHEIVQPKPSLVPLVTNEEWIRDLQGLSLKNVSIELLKNNKKIYSDFGEMLFTHYGVSGPIILSGSRHLVNSDFKKDMIKLNIDFKPALSEEQLDVRIQKDFDKYSNKDFQNSLDDLLPKKMIPIIVRLAKIDPNKKVHQITKNERLVLVRLLKKFEINITGTRPIAEGIVTCGGVNTTEINPSTMESKITEGLYFTGEVIDLDAYTGGFNLQIAWSTGYLAGINV